MAGAHHELSMGGVKTKGLSCIGKYMWSFSETGAGW